MADAGKVLEVAQRTSGTVLGDSKLLESFEALLISHIAPATVARSLALALVEGGYSPEIWGNNWPAMGRGADLRRGGISDGDYCHELFSRSGFVVIPWYSHAGVQLAVDFLARGSVVLMRGSQKDFAAGYPNLAAGVDTIHWFQSSSTMISTLRDLIAHPDRATRQSRLAAQQIRKEHTLAHRLRALFQRIRDAQSKSKSLPKELN